MTSLYMDASALVKRYSQEQGTDEVIRLLATSNRVFTSKVTYVELLMTFRRKQVDGTLNSLRALDAIHLSSALLAKKLVGKKLTFVCSDQKLQEAASAQGLTVHNPAM